MLIIVSWIPIISNIRLGSPISVCLIKEGKMTINKLTLAAALTIGLMAGTMNSGIASNVDISSLDMS